MSRRTKKTKKDHQKKHKIPIESAQKGLSVRVLGRSKIEQGKKTMADVVTGKEELIEKKLLQVKEKAGKNLAPEKTSENPPLKKVMETQAEIEKNKRLIMWSGIAFFMIIIVLGWFYNTKKVFEANRLENLEQTEIVDLDELIDELGDKIKDMKEDLEAVKSFSEDTASSTGVSVASSTPDYFSLPETDLASSSEEESGMLSEDEIEDLKEVLEEKASQKIKIVY